MTYSRSTPDPTNFSLLDLLSRNCGRGTHFIALGLLAVAVNLMVLSTPAQAQTPERLALLEEMRLQDQTLAFVIEEQEVGRIRNIIDYLLLHGRTHLDQKNPEAAANEFQLAAGFMELNAGRGTTDDQNKVRATAKEIEKLGLSLQSSKSMEGISLKDVDKLMFDAHSALAQYHQRRAVRLLETSNPPQRWPHTSVEQPEALYQHKAGLALRAALVHFDKATQALARIDEVEVAMGHEEAVNRTYQFARALKNQSGQVDNEKARRAIQKLGEAIKTLNMKSARLRDVAR